MKQISKHLKQKNLSRAVATTVFIVSTLDCLFENIPDKFKMMGQLLSFNTWRIAMSKQIIHDTIEELNDETLHFIDIFSPSMVLHNAKFHRDAVHFNSGSKFSPYSLLDELVRSP